MRTFCWTCHRPTLACFCALTRPFQASVDIALIVHPREVNSTVGTAWILRRSISNLEWIQSNGIGLDQDSKFLKLVHSADRVPLLLFPGHQAINLSHASTEQWKSVTHRRPVFIVIDGTWTQARVMLKRSQILQSLPRVSFDTTQPSEYEFKKQPDPTCLSSVEGVHHLLELIASRGWGSLPSAREHEQMIAIFKSMVRFQLQQESIYTQLRKNLGKNLGKTLAARELAVP